ncbi:peptidase S8 [Micractinium conductrix]|uniref:Peptidase S8 n=1 Tax=Micractinium conductrix TaxID=554055 RepID=A0A2P6VSC7_9CHLO|nr:peptidase S8 [Micractinium conductrix]|eukprot:PSC76977.1 peptidase S8 [Micractinium conductrix]
MACQGRIRSALAAALALALAVLLSGPACAHAGSLQVPGSGAGARRWMTEVAAASSQPEVPEYATDRVIVSFNPNVVSAMAAEQEGLQFQKPAGLQGAIVYKITDGEDVMAKIKHLQNHPAVSRVEPDYKVTAYYKPDDSNYNLQWHHPVIGSERAWNFTTGSTDVKVCVVDSGVRVDHPDLAANVLKGWNFVPAGQKQNDPPPKAGTPEYFNYNDTYGHGTHVAGIIGAIGNNKQGIAGMNWNVKLLICRFIWNDGAGYVSDAMNCIKLCKQEGALITSNSWGGIGYSSFLEREIAVSQDAGQLFVVASGNNGVNMEETKLYPASYKTDNMISVASSGEKDFVSSFSNIGMNTVHLLAPGEAIYSTYKDGGYKAMWGTSMACPMVTGTAALLQAGALSHGITLGYAELKSLILSSVDKVDDGADKVITGGRLNVTASMLALQVLLASRGVQNPLGEPSAASPPPPSPPPPRPSPPPPRPASPPPPAAGTYMSAGIDTAVVCGTTPLRGLGSATQSSTNGVYDANLAIDGVCTKKRMWQGSCAQTMRQGNPWWAVQLAAAARPVLAVSIQTSSECACVADLQNARIMVGSTPWTSHASAANFTLCATVSGIVRGQRKTFACAAAPGGAPPVGQYLAIWRPGPVRRALTLCEVDAVLGAAPTRRALQQARGDASTAAALRSRRLQAAPLLPLDQTRAGLYTDAALAIMKRARDEDIPLGVMDALADLQYTLERGDAGLKLRALDRIIALVDPSDDSYTVQKALLAGDAAFFIVELLSDATAGAAAAEAVAAVTRHAAPTLARLTAGPLVGLDSSVERVALNPCQSDFVDSGALSSLVPMLFARQEAAREAATEAVAALCSFHQEGKLAYLEGLVGALLQGAQPEALPHLLELLDSAIDGMEVGSDAATQQVELLLPALAAELQGAAARPTAPAALALAATVCEKHAPAAEELRRGGAVAAVARHLLQGPLAAQDAAARLLWLLARGERRCLATAEGQLGCEPLALAQVLSRLLEMAEEQARAREEESDGEGNDGQEGDASAGAALASSRDAGNAAAEVCHEEEAAQLLRALAVANPAVQAWLDERQVPVPRPGAQCCIS